MKLISRIKNRLRPFPFYKQFDGKDCGPTCLKIISAYYKKHLSIQDLRNLSKTSREGSSLYNISKAAESIGFDAFGTKISFETLLEAPLPSIVFWKNYHYVVLYKIDPNRVYVADPAMGKVKYSHSDFIKNWINETANGNTEEGIILLLEPNSDFGKQRFNCKKTNPYSRFIKYLKKQKTLLLYLILALLIENIISFFFPFFTKNIVDKGIKPKNINFIYTILFAQLALFLGQIIVEAIRSRILLHLSNRINIVLVSDFLKKMMRLPISFFDSRITGDLIQRMNDNYRVQSYLTGSSLNTFFSFIHFIVFGSILLYYNYQVFVIFFIGSILYTLWLLFFSKKRKILDYMRFEQQAEERSKTMEIISGMQEIKLNRAESQKTTDWEKIQNKIYRIQIKLQNVELWQNIGSSFLNHLKDILITFISASLVINNKITLGEMLSIQFIVGQLNIPLSQLVDFIRSSQDAKISLERLNEIYEKENEDERKNIENEPAVKSEDIYLKEISFSYFGNDMRVLDNISLTIPKNKITAIVGTSGSGKTSLMKLLLKFYEPDLGNISLGKTNFMDIHSGEWRKNIGAVMQDGFIFNDTIAKNIAVGEEDINFQKLNYAIEIANLNDFISTLPLKLSTQIGADGNGISGGQKQRILIARAVYKNPQFLFFDEATSALDSENEKIIHDNLQFFFKEKTVIIIAHRLSTVKNADKIVVLDNGKIVEIGSHQELTKMKGSYFELVKNQLELGG
ncbi:MAG: ABC transporter ATP-binding protein [Chryseobacterium sp.]|nr:MAG: ABC transporter ATP-binding protein [Chryseobacterium sp.]